MSEQLSQIQQMALSKPAAAVGVGTATVPAWVEWVTTSPVAQAAVIVIGVIVSVTIIAVNVQTLIHRRRG